MQPHPAPFSQPIIDRLREMLVGETKVRALDPFAGKGRVLELLPASSKATLIEIEPLFVAEGLAYIASLNGQVDPTVKWQFVAAESAGWLARNRRTYTHIITSPTYGNRMRDPYRSKPGTECRSYAQSVGGPLQAHNSGQWKLSSDQYLNINYSVMRAAAARLVPGGKAYINVSDFYHTPTKGAPPRREQVGSYWVDLMTLPEMGMHMASVEQVQTRRFTRGENRHRVPYEYILIFEKE